MGGDVGHYEGHKRAIVRSERRTAVHYEEFTMGTRHRVYDWTKGSSDAFQ